MSRIFKQMGHGYGAAPVSIVAQIDGNTVYSGTVPTTDEPVPGEEPGVQLGLDCFQWTEPVANFVGTRSYSISCSGGIFQLGATAAQWNLANAASFGFVYEQMENFGAGNVLITDPLTDVSINGVPQTRPDDPTVEGTLPGQWGWVIPDGGTLTATLNVNVLNPPA